MSDMTPRPRRRRIAGETPAPVEPTPAKKTAAKKAPAKKAAAKKTTAAEAPAAKTPAKKAAGKKAPAAKTTAKKAPAAKTPAKKAPATKAPAKKTAAPSSRVAAAVAARDTGAPTPTPSRPPATPRATSSTPVEPTPAAPRPGLGAVASIALLLVGAALAVFGVVRFVTGEADGDPVAAARESAVSSASVAAETIFSFSYDDLEAHATESKALMTASFAEEYDTIAPALDDLAPQRQVEVEAKVRNAAVLPCGDDCSPSKASVLVFLDQDRRLADDDTATVFGNRIVVDLVRSGGDWKVDDIRAL